MGPGLKPGPTQASLSAARAPRRFARLPIRHKLLVLVLLPLLGVLPVLCAALLHVEVLAGIEHGVAHSRDFDYCEKSKAS